MRKPKLDQVTCLYDGHTKARAAELRRERIAAAKASVRAHKPKVIGIRNNGEEVTVEFTRTNGERVIATYGLSCWNRMPTEVALEYDRMLQGPSRSGRRE